MGWTAFAWTNPRITDWNSHWSIMQSGMGMGMGISGLWFWSGMFPTTKWFDVRDGFGLQGLRLGMMGF